MSTRKNRLSDGIVAVSMGKGGMLRVILSGQLGADSSASVWQKIDLYLNPKKVNCIEVDATALDRCDGAGQAVFLNLKRFSATHQVPLEMKGLAADIQQMLTLYPVEGFCANESPAKNGRDFIESVGKATAEVLISLREQIAFLGELSVAFFRLITHPRGLRMKDFLMAAENSGVRALPIIAMLGFLVGLIMAFQGAVSMSQFGAEIYIADFVGLSVLRELGPLITGIIMAGRTGSAFAAELGTMKVNEEIDAFTTMGLDPIRFLVVPRVLAATLMTPLLAVFTNLCGLAGGAVVMLGIGFPLVTYINRVVAAVSLTDLVSGLFKAVVFGFIVAASGCLSGLRTGEGASAVGDSATRAVVSSIVMIVAVDGIFAVIFYYMGI